MMSKNDRQHRWTRTLSQVTAWLVSFPAILGSVALIIIWAVSGPLFGFSDTWQLVINTGTTIITFNMVFVIQNTTNRESQAINLKLNALIKSNETISNKFLNTEDLPEEHIKDLQKEVRQHEHS